MLSEDTLQALPSRIVARLEQLNIDYLALIGNQIKEIGRLSPDEAFNLQYSKHYNEAFQKIALGLAALTTKNVGEIYEIFNIVAKDSINFAKPFYDAKGLNFVPYEDNLYLQRQVYALAQQTAETYINMSNTTAFMMYDDLGNKVFTSLSDTYINAIDKAVVNVTLGGIDYQSAMRQTLKDLADSGIRTKYSPLQGSAGKAIDYASGYSRRLDTAVRQNVLWGVKNANQTLQDMIGSEFGADGYEISYHSRPRPTHAAMGGQQYTEKEFIQQGIQDLLEDFNCYHFKFSIIIGVSKPTYLKKELATLKYKDNQKFSYEGNNYTGYEATQVQRKLETQIRHAKDRQLIAKAAGDDTLRRQEQSKINNLVDKYSSFSNAAGLPVKTQRMSVSGYHRVKAI